MIGLLRYLPAVRGAPEHLRSDHGPEFLAGEVRRWPHRASVNTPHTRKASPSAKACVESRNGKLRDELFNHGLFHGLEEARYMLDPWRLDDNHRRPHAPLYQRTPAARDEVAAGVFAVAADAGPAVGLRPCLRLSIRSHHPRFSHND